MPENLEIKRMQDNQTLKFYGLDGDRIGSVVETYMVRNELETLATFSSNVSTALEAIRDDVLQRDGFVIFCAGDSILFRGQFDADWCRRRLSTFVEVTGRTASLGVGDTAMAAYLALRLAKAMGGGMILQLPPLYLPDPLL